MVERFTLIILFVFTSSVGMSNAPFCNLKCKEIPPMEESYVYWGEEASNTLNKDSIKILVWNLYKGKKESFAPEYLDLASRADVSITQEISADENMLPVLNQIFGHSYHYAISFLMDSGVSTGVATSSQAPSILSIHQRTEDREPIVKSPKMNMITKYQLSNGQKLLVINIHGMNATKDVALQRQIELAKPYVASHTGPVIFAGDFNTRNSNRLENTDNFMQSLGLRRIEFENDDRFFKLDHLYFKGLILKQKFLLDDLKGSDHPAIFAEFSSHSSL